MNLNKYRIARAAAYPQRLQLEPSHACTLSCPFCRRVGGREQNQAQLPPEVLAKLEGVLAQADVLDISGWGEPLAGDAIWRVLDRAAWSRINTCLSTNGTLMGDEACRRLAEGQAGQVTVSLDAGSAEGYARLRPGAKLETVTENIKLLARAREAAGGAGPLICISFNFHEASAAEFPGFIRLAAGLPVCKAVVHPCFPAETESGRGSYRLSRAARRHYGSGMALAGELGLRVEVYLKAVLDMQLGVHNEECVGKRCLPTLEEVRAGGLFPTCRCAWDYPYIDHEGGVYPCCNYPRPFGSLLRESFEEIWDGERFTQFRNGLVSHDPDPCCLGCRRTMWYANRLGEHTEERVALGNEGLIGLGWYEPEELGRGGFRWSRGRATVYLRHRGRPKLYFVASALRQTRVEVLVGERVIGQLDVHPRWEVCMVDLPPLDRTILRVSIRCPDAQNDPAAASPHHRLRLLGIAVSQIGTCVSEHDEEPRRALRQILPWRFPLHTLRSGVSQWMRALFMP